MSEATVDHRSRKSAVRHSVSHVRPGYTLVEILVVSALILLLVGLLLVVVRKIVHLIHSLLGGGFLW